MKNYLQQLTQLTSQYNDAIRALENAYDLEQQQEGFMSRMFAVLESKYSDRYDVLAEEYRQKRRQLFTAYKQSNPVWATWRKRWGILFYVGIMFLFVGCLGHLGSIAEDNPDPAPAATSQLSARLPRHTGMRTISPFLICKTLRSMCRTPTTYCNSRR